MADIFISYASQDRQRARDLAAALEARGWSVWWDREIPLGESFDAVIERAMAEARCVLVLWSAASAASDWVRSEASEGKRRGILLPVFLEEVEAPLAFRLLNGARLDDWLPGAPHPELDRLMQRVAVLLDKAPAAVADIPPHASRTGPGPWPSRTRMLAAAVAAGVLLPLGGYLWLSRSEPPPGPLPTQVSPPAEVAAAGIEPPVTGAIEPSAGGEPPPDDFANLAAALQPLALGLSAGGMDGAAGGNLALRAFKLPEMGMDIAYVSPEQSRSVAGALPAGAVVWAVAAGPARQADLRALDVITAINGQAIASDADLRRLLRAMGPGRHEFKLRRDGRVLSARVDCPDCKPG